MGVEPISEASKALILSLFPGFVLHVVLHLLLEIFVDHLIYLLALGAECVLVDAFHGVCGFPTAALHGVFVGHTQLEHDRGVDMAQIVKGHVRQPVFLEQTGEPL